MIEAYFDGACEPINPGGTASFGAVIFKDGARLWECSRLFIPEPGRESETSNNVAEYSGFLAILEWLLEAHAYHGEPVIIRGDSKLVIQQMLGRWRMLGGYYVPVAEKAKATLKKTRKKYRTLDLQWIPREQNGLADELSKAELLKANVPFRLQPEPVASEG